MGRTTITLDDIEHDLGTFNKITVPVREGGLRYRASTRREGHSREFQLTGATWNSLIFESPLHGFLQRIIGGEALLIVEADKPIVELKPLPQTTDQLRPFGLCAGEFTVPKDFDVPLPEDVLAAFESTRA